VRRRVLLIYGYDGRRRQSLCTRKSAHVVEQIPDGRPRRKVESEAITAEHVGVRCEEQDIYGHRA
jgi:hypothetical protein